MLSPKSAFFVLIAITLCFWAKFCLILVQQSLPQHLDQVWSILPASELLPLKPQTGPSHTDNAFFWIYCTVSKGERCDKVRWEQRVLECVLLRVGWEVYMYTSIYQFIGHVILELSSYLLEIPNDAYTTRSQFWLAVQHSVKSTASR